MTERNSTERSKQTVPTMIDAVRVDTYPGTRGGAAIVTIEQQLRLMQEELRVTRHKLWIYKKYSRMLTDAYGDFEFGEDASKMFKRIYDAEEWLDREEAKLD